MDASTTNQGTRPELSVVVPSRGGARRLPRLLSALAEQQSAPDFEICVVLDGDVHALRTVPVPDVPTMATPADAEAAQGAAAGQGPPVVSAYTRI